jgi:hypothetical protein
MNAPSGTPKNSFWLNLWNAAGTGGLSWHWHALMHRHLWKRSCEQIARFLDGIEPTTPHLLLIGPSAGWMLPTAWLEKFQRIDVFDIDPLVPLLFGLRHGLRLTRRGVVVRYHRVDAMLEMDQLLTQHPDACVWFDNILGQHRYRVRNLEATEQTLNALKNQLANRAWGSVHDWLSGPVKAVSPLEAVCDIAARSQDASWAQQRLAQIQAYGTWSDHLTSCVFPLETNCQYIAWPYSDEYSHWLQIGWLTLGK